MILSESEKNRIKGLYGLVTEADASAPPPDESVLVAKKNPFKDKSIMDMVTKDGKFIRYDKDLVDGDTFLSYNSGNIKQYFQSIGEDFFNRNFLGKTIRYIENGTDYTKKLEEKNLYIIDDTSYITPKTLYGFRELGFKYPWITYDFNKDIVEGGRLGFSGPEYDISEETKNKLLQIFRGNKDKFSMSNVPDEYFEIRKIQREKTDF